MNEPSVLVLRVNASIEIIATRSSIDAIVAAFPGARIVTVATPQSEALPLVEIDPRFSEVLMFPPDGAGRRAKTPLAFRSFLQKQRLQASVLSLGQTPHLNYRKHFLSLFACPGKKYVSFDSDVFGLLSPRGIGVLLAYTLPDVKSGLAALLANTVKALVRGARAFSRRPPESLGTASVRRILWIRLDHVGDAAVAISTLGSLKAAFPAASIDALIHPSTKPLFADANDVNEIITYTGKSYARGAKADRLWPLIFLLRRRRYDLAIDLRGEDSARLISFLSGARWQAGPVRSIFEHHNKPNLACLYSHPVDLAALPKQPIHVLEHNWAIIEGLGLTANRDIPYLPISSERRRRVEETLKSLGQCDRIAVIHPNPAEDFRRWSVERFAAVADYLVAKHGLCVLITGAPDESAYNAQIIGHVKETGFVHDVAGMFALADLAALFARADLVITLDTGPMHIAGGVGVPTVSLILPWQAPLFHPYGQVDGVLHSPSLRGRFFMTDPDVFKQFVSTWQGRYLDAISIEEVLAAIDLKLEQARRR